MSPFRRSDFSNSKSAGKQGAKRHRSRMSDSCSGISLSLAKEQNYGITCVEYGAVF